ncbi:MAG: hypothetical protein VB142_05610 [Burkholderia sp.]
MARHEQPYKTIPASRSTSLIRIALWQARTQRKHQRAAAPVHAQGYELAVFSQAELDDIAWQMNAHPRKSLGWTCPANCSCRNCSMFVNIIMKSLPWGMPFVRNRLLLYFNLETALSATMPKGRT